MVEEASIHSSLGPLSKSYESIYQKRTPYFKKNFPWRIIVLQYCVDCCCTTTWISHNYIYISPPWASLHPTPPPPPPRPFRLSQSSEGWFWMTWFPSTLHHVWHKQGTQALLNYSFLNMVRLTGEINSSSLWGGRLGLKRFYCMYFGSSCFFPHLLIFPMKNKNDEKEVLNLYEL